MKSSLYQSVETTFDSIDDNGYGVEQWGWPLFHLYKRYPDQVVKDFYSRIYQLVDPHDRRWQHQPEPYAADEDY